VDGFHILPTLSSSTLIGLGNFDAKTLSGDIEGSNAEMARRVCVRYIRKDRRIAKNVAKGEFRGKY